MASQRLPLARIGGQVDVRCGQVQGVIRRPRVEISPSVTSGQVLCSAHRTRHKTLERLRLMLVLVAW